MLKIKLIRFGKKGQPHYRVVVQEARTKRDGQYTALLGRYVPTQTPKILELDLNAYKEWLAKGAQPTETVAALAKRAESNNPFPAKKAKPSKKQVAKAQAEAEAKAAAEAEAKAAAEAPAPEVAPTEETPVAEEAPASEEATTESTEPAAESTEETTPAA